MLLFLGWLLGGSSSDDDDDTGPCDGDCPRCNGWGYVNCGGGQVEDPCKRCGGTGNA